MKGSWDFVEIEVDEIGAKLMVRRVQFWLNFFVEQCFLNRKVLQLE